MLMMLIRGFADAADRIGATIVALSIMGGWLLREMHWTIAAIGVLMGLGLVVMGVYTKTRIDKEGRS